jgi:phosphoribosylanthranilate isomerase
MSPKIKICGLTNSKDARDAVNCGASFLGVIFAETSPRRVELENAKTIRGEKTDSVSLVGVFQNQPLAAVNAIADKVNLDFVQLHGEESAEYCQAIERPVIKVVNLKNTVGDQDQNLTAIAAEYSFCAKYLMFDKPKGENAQDWLKIAVDRIAVIESKLPPYFFAGGLNVANLEMVLSRLQPYCLDVSSSVEKRVGEKDIEVMRAFCDLAKRASKNSKTAKTGG